MTIEERIKKDPAGFQSLMETKTADIKAALDELSARLDVIFGGAIKEYCESEQVEADMDHVSDYKAMNKIITGQLDVIIADHIKEKRKDI